LSDGAVLWDKLQLIAPYVMVLAGLGFLFKDEPPLSAGRSGAQRTFKILAWVLLIGAGLYFTLDFNRFHESQVRVVGVLQRIAICYFFGSLIVMFTGVRGRIAWSVGLLAGYWLIVKFVPPPAEFMEMLKEAGSVLSGKPDDVSLTAYAATLTGSELAHKPAGMSVTEYLDFFSGSVRWMKERPVALLHEWIDFKLIGNHVYGERPDPEGLLSTIPAIGSVLLGVLTGNWMKSSREKMNKAVGMLIMGIALVLLGMLLDRYFPINKKIWTSSYVVYTTGLGLLFLAICYWLIDMKGYKKWAYPFLVYGTNSILVFFLAHMVSKCMGMYGWETSTGQWTSLYGWCYQTLFASWAGPLNGSLAFAISYVVLWVLLVIPLYRKRIFLKI
jgi:predicted acyltransferase